ncbi:hypothetical protein V1525DRAFT_415015 [Lipomyces kononenkoae]|uniref:Uncharacterized protein n=1 Tax=Lipomyces kononenkoae TaxID=34357 RepID=A0ACC3SR65_LIPKO
MGNISKMIAEELNPDRAKALERMVRRAGASIVRVETSDFTEALPAEWTDVTKMLCDPEGFVAAAVSNDETEEQENGGEATSGDALTKRLMNLSICQSRIAKHALTRFPNATRLVYSTCSDAAENEDVVRKLLMDPEVAKLGWKAMVRENVIIPHGIDEGGRNGFKGWNGHKVRRAVCAQTHGGIGFFVAVIVGMVINGQVPVAITRVRNGLGLMMSLPAITRPRQ